MKEFIDRLNKEQLEYLKQIKNDFENMATEELDEWLTDYFQKQDIENIDNNKELLLLESILDVLGDI